MANERFEKIIINNREFSLVKILTKEEFNWIKKFVLKGMFFMRTEISPPDIKIKVKYIGKYKNSERTKPAQAYLCKCKKGYYISLDHGYPKPQMYGVIKKRGKDIIYEEGYKDVPLKDENMEYAFAEDEPESSLWEVYRDSVSL